MNISIIISITCALFCVFIFFYFKWYIKRRTSDSKLLDEYRTEVNRLIVEVNAATDRDMQLVEDRIKKLKTILDDTDKRISVYIRELEKSRTGEALYTSLGRGIRAALNTQVEPAPPSEKTEPQKPYAVKQDSGIPSEPSGETSAQSPSKTYSRRQIRAQIDAMVDQGLPPGEIASRLEISLAEVDLAMNLINRQKKRS
jgi:hypothetical protein